MSDARASESGFNFEARHHFEHLIVDFTFTDVVVCHVDLQRRHVDSRDIESHWILGLPEVCWILVHAEAASVHLLEHVFELGCGHLSTTQVNGLPQVFAVLRGGFHANFLDLVCPVWTIERLDA